MEKEAAAASKPHVVLLASPGSGHFIPVLELGKRLATLHHFHVTIFDVSSATHSPNNHLCHIIPLPPVDISDLVDPYATVITRLCVIMRQIRPALRSAISSLHPRPTALIVDLFGTESLPIADELGIPKFVFIATNASFFAVTVYVPTLDKEVVGEYVDQEEAFGIPGCMPLRPEDVIDPMLDRSNQVYGEYLRMGAEIPTADGILVNTWEDLQSKTLTAFRDQKLLGGIVKAPVFPIGPLTRPAAGPENPKVKEPLEWLGNQPMESVVYVSFGSGGTHSMEQMRELAWGLEMSQHPFIWVVRPPTDKSGDGSFFTVGDGDDDMSCYLPDGFLGRTRNVGLVIPRWARQMEILSHPSVGGFISHCGWNSILESIVNGVPMIAWPLYAEQKLNAAMLSEEIGVAVRTKTSPSKGVVGREEIKTLIRRIMEADEGGNNIIRKRVKEVKESAEKSLRKGGSSYNALAVVAKECGASCST